MTPTKHSKQHKVIKPLPYGDGYETFARSDYSCSDGCGTLPGGSLGVPLLASSYIKFLLTSFVILKRLF
jgi:hypothetical protein